MIKLVDKAEEQLHIFFSSAKTWRVIVCWFLCFPPTLPELCLKLFCSDAQNNSKFSSGKLRGKHRNQQKSHVKFWLNWIKYGAVSHSLSCNIIRRSRMLFKQKCWQEFWSKLFKGILMASAFLSGILIIKVEFCHFWFLVWKASDF